MTIRAAVIHGGMPCRLRAPHQRRKRHSHNRGSKDRHKDGAADVEEHAEHQQENADCRGNPDRLPSVLDAIDRMSVAHVQRLARCTAGTDIVHNAL